MNDQPLTPDLKEPSGIGKKIKIVVLLVFVILLVVGDVLFYQFYFEGWKYPAEKPPTDKPPVEEPDEESAKKGSLEEKLQEQSKIKKFTSYEELQKFLETHIASFASAGVMRGGMTIEEASPSGIGGMGNMALEDTGMPMKSEAPSEKSDDYSRTNVQVEGVDEADIIKTDGEYIYAVSKNNLFIVKAYPPQNAEILAKIEFKSMPQDIFINEDSDRMVVFGRNDVFHTEPIYEKYRRDTSFTFFKVFDISDKGDPQILRELDFEGNYYNSRMIGDYVYFVTQIYIPYYYDGNDEIPVPRILEDGKMIKGCEAPINEKKCIIGDIYYFDIPYSEYAFNNVIALDVKKPKGEVDSESYVLGYDQNLFVSLDSLYLTYTKHLNEDEIVYDVFKDVIFPQLPADLQAKIKEVEAISDDILSQEDKLNKIEELAERHFSLTDPEEFDRLGDLYEQETQNRLRALAKELEKTVIHKIMINKGKLEYKTFGEVTGQVLNQFSMDEYDGYFRIATTKGRDWRFDDELGESYSNVYVLDEDMKVVGALEKLAKDEEIYSARFMGKRAYLVTFKQMDPFFAIDLSDPLNPKVLGELKMPGFSEYLHPYDENTIIGLGRETSETKWGGVTREGVKLSLFDVSDVSNPKEIDKYVFTDESSSSIALDDHKAFLFSKEKSLLVIPVTLREFSIKGGIGIFSFEGAVVFSVDKEKGFDLRGKIDHSDGSEGEGSDWYGYYYYDNMVKRSLYIGDILYTFSDKYLKMNELSDLSLVSELELKKEKFKRGSDFEVIK